MIEQAMHFSSDINRVRLPEARDELIAGIDRIIAEAGEEKLRAFRDANPLM